MNMTHHKSGLRWLWLAVLAFVLDQASKLAVVKLLPFGYPGVEITPFFNLVHVYNKGAAFSFLADQPGWQRWFFTGLGLAASVFIVWMMHTHRTQHRFMLALALILGGALGNVIDRIAYGHVVDFLLFYWQDWYYPAFNIADAGITVGAILLVIDEILRLRGQHARSS